MDKQTKTDLKKKTLTGLCGKLLAAIMLTVMGFFFFSFQNVQADTIWVDFTITCNGELSGEVGKPIEPFYFSVKLRDAYFDFERSDGTDVTSWFTGFVNERAGIYNLTPLGLTFKTVGDIHNGDTEAHFVVTGTPWFAASHCMSFLGVPYGSNIPKEQRGPWPETTGCVKFNIIRNGYGLKGGVTPDNLVISGEQGTPITPVDINIELYGNLITNLYAGQDVSSWFRTGAYHVASNSDSDYISALLPKGLKATIKNAAHIGDKSFIVTISGTPQHGSHDFIYFVTPAGYVAINGGPKDEQGYSGIGSGYRIGKWKYDIEGDDVTPRAVPDPVTIETIVGEEIPDNLVTFRLQNCTIAKTLEPGTSIYNWFRKYNFKSDGWYGYAFENFGNTLKVEIVRFQEGEDYFTCKFTGVAKTTGSQELRLLLDSDLTTHPVRVWSTSDGKAVFVSRDPDIGPKPYISERTIEMKHGFYSDLSDDPFDVGITGGRDAQDYQTIYALYMNKQILAGTDISTYFKNLPSGVKAYAATDFTRANSAEYQDQLQVYFKGTPTKTGTYNISFWLGAYDYTRLDLDKTEYYANGNHWYYYTNEGCNEAKASQTELTLVVSEGETYGYVYDNSVIEDPKQLSYEEFEGISEETPMTPIVISGKITHEKSVKVTEGTPKVVEKTVHSFDGKQFGIYIPSKITLRSNYAAGADIKNVVRLKNAPLSNYTLRTVNALSKGDHNGLTVLVYIDGDDIKLTQSSKELEIQFSETGGSKWNDLKVPVGSVYEIGEIIFEDPDTSKCTGLSATIMDCSVNGIVGSPLEDKLGVEITVVGDTFAALAKGTDATGWFENLPKGLYASVKENVKAGDASVKIIFAKTNSSGQFVQVTPRSACTGPIEVCVPFSVLTGGQSGATRYGIVGGVANTINTKANFCIMTADDLISEQGILVVSQKIMGIYGTTKDAFGNDVFLPMGGKDDEIVIYSAVYGESRAKLNNRNKGGGASTKDIIRCNSLDNWTFWDNDINLNSVRCDEFSGINILRYNFPKGDAYATSITSGWFNLYINSIMAGEDRTFISYEISDTPAQEDDNEWGEADENDDDDNGETEPVGEKPDIWINGKDFKKEDRYNKSMTVEISKFIASLPDGCKYVVSVTDTTVTDAEGAFSSGKGKKSNMAKAAYKKATDSITVTAGKTAGTARVWVGAVDKKNTVQDSGYIDVLVGTAPKKIYVTRQKGAAATATVKNVALNPGEQIVLYANSNGTELSPHSSFTWTDVKESGYVQIVPSSDTQKAVIKVISAPTTGKTQKVNVAVVNVESGKKVNVSILVSNGVVSVNGLSDAINLESAKEAVVDKTLAYTLVCADGSSSTTDKIKVFTTSATEEGSGYSNNGKKFTLTSKSKIKVTYKNGEFSLKVPKKTADGTKARVLIVVTHADKTVEVFEGGVITVGQAP